MIKRWLLVVTLCCSMSAGLSEKTPSGNPQQINWREKYAQQLKANEDLVEHEQVLNGHIKSQDKTIDKQDREIEKFKIQEKERMIIDIFGVGISKDEANGFIWGAATIATGNPIFLLGIVFF